MPAHIIASEEFHNEPADPIEEEIQNHRFTAGMVFALIGKQNNTDQKVPKRANQLNGEEWDPIWRRGAVNKGDSILFTGKPVAAAG